MTLKEQLPILVGMGMIIVAIATGTCSTNSRIDDVNRRIDDGFANVNRRFDDMNRRIDDVHNRIDGVETEVRELRRMFIEHIQASAAQN